MTDEIELTVMSLGELRRAGVDVARLADDLADDLNGAWREADGALMVTGDALTHRQRLEVALERVHRAAFAADLHPAAI